VEFEKRIKKHTCGRNTYASAASWPLVVVAIVLSLPVPAVEVALVEVAMVVVKVGVVVNATLMCDVAKPQRGT
jgi:hypothetical protein